MEGLDPQVEAQYKVLKTKLSQAGNKIKAIIEQGRSIESDASQLFLYKGMYKELKPYFNSFNETWDKLLELIDDRKLFPTKKETDLSTAVERYYYEGCAIYEEYINPTPTPAPAVPTQQNVTTNSTQFNESRTVRARLPQINLPQFGGTPGDWPLFRDTYKSLIHSETSLSDMEKFLFLVSCLSGSARSLITNVSLTEANYAQAWKLLTDHYNDKRKLAFTYLKQALEFKPQLGRPTSTSLKTLITSVVEVIDSFKHLDIKDSGDFILSYIVLRCLDPATKTLFEKKYAEVEFPTYKNLIDFIKTEWKSLDTHYLESDTPLTNRKINPPVFSPASPRFISNSRNSFFTGNCSQDTRTNHPTHGRKPISKNNAYMNFCPVCQANHTLYQCERFKNSSAENKLAFLKNWYGCTNCLSNKHPTHSCTSLRRCSTCNQGHHSWLHQSKVQQIAPQPTPAASTSVVPSNQDCGGITLGSLCSTEGDVLLGTAMVKARNTKGDYHTIRLVTDSGSQFSFITLECVLKLGLVIEPLNKSVAGIGQVKLPNTVGIICCNIRSTISSFSSKEITVRAVVVTKISNELHQTVLSKEIQDNYKGYVLADPNYWKPGPVEFLLGGDHFFDILTAIPILIKKDIPRLVPTIFGFIIAGPLGSLPKSSDGYSFFNQSYEELKDVMKKFWEVEEVTPVSTTSQEDDYCEKHYQTTHYRLESGRYVVSLPFKSSIDSLKNTQAQALKRLVNLEAKLAKESLLKEEYHSFMKDYINLGHMTLVKSGTSAYTIPHHPVIKTQEGRMKLRVVFDASCRSYNGSLNDHLYSGPKLQLDIRNILMNFRTHEFVFTADIVKMFRQIQVHQKDRKYQHILWRFDPSEAVQEYELCTVTQGETSAPFDAERTIVQLVRDEGSPYPLASKALLEDIYVDDLATGANTEKEAKQLQEELIQLLAKGCFELSKWASNSKVLLQSINKSDCQHDNVCLASEDEPKIKLLGMQWVPNRDIFTYEITNPTWHPSKRAILSAIAHVYDPLGFLSPVIMYAKIILQDMWISQCEWDDIGPPQICLRWHTFLSQLNAISQIKIPRCIVSSNVKSYSIFGFCDASQRGYSAVLYLLAQTDLDCHTYVLKAKTKLAPIKPMTIPRLELSGALLLSRLFKSCDRLYSKLSISTSNFYTDSEIVLGWLSTAPQRLNAFVAHRVVNILELTDRSNWHHVKSEDNPADCSSRGLLPSEFVNYSLWWAGPQWLKSPQYNRTHNQIFNAEDLPEIKKNAFSSLVAVHSKLPGILDWMERFSHYSRLLRSISYMQRFITKCKRGLIANGSVTIQEMRDAANVCIRITQAHHKVDDKHLRTLRPFLDKDGMLRVGGRLENSTLQQDQKHPIILSAKSHLAKILIDHYHKSHLHIGPTALQALLNTRYWIVSARKLIRQRIFNCIKCYKANHSPQSPLMGNLPAFRLEEGRVFHHVGVDFGGPFLIRESLRRKASLGKAYLSLFVCMTTKALHLELVSSCSTEAFLAALDRFVSRRGKPMHMYSDCGANFIGAANQLKDLILGHRSTQHQKELSQYTASKDIQWSFNPPSAPHFGGIWESGIKAAKTILKRVIGETPLTFEELATLFCMIEAILNSRPLTPITSDPDCIECLTPGHFLVGRPLTSVPEENFIDEKLSPLKRWSLIKQRSQHFWMRWKTEYLHQLQQRTKWTSNIDNLKEGDIVIIKEPKSPQRTWPLARVVAVHPGADNIVRVATVKTATGIYKRPVVKLVPLIPVNQNTSF